MRKHYYLIIIPSSPTPTVIPEQNSGTRRTLATHTVWILTLALA